MTEKLFTGTLNHNQNKTKQNLTVSFTCSTDDFQKSQKTAIFENCVKNLSFEKKSNV